MLGGISITVRRIVPLWPLPTCQSGTIHSANWEHSYHKNTQKNNQERNVGASPTSSRLNEDSKERRRVGIAAIGNSGCWAYSGNWTNSLQEKSERSLRLRVDSFANR